MLYKTPITHDFSLSIPKHLTSLQKTAFLDHFLSKSKPDIQIFTMFSIAKLFTAALAVTSVAVAAVTPQEAVDGLRLLTQKAQDLQAPAQSISIVNAPLVVIGQGPVPVCVIVGTDSHSGRAANKAQRIITGIDDQTKTAHALNFAEITPAGDELVFNAYREVMP